MRIRLIRTDIAGRRRIRSLMHMLELARRSRALNELFTSFSSSVFLQISADLFSSKFWLIWLFLQVLADLNSSKFQLMRYSPSSKQDLLPPEMSLPLSAQLIFRFISLFQVWIPKLIQVKADRPLEEVYADIKEILQAWSELNKLCPQQISSN